MRIIAALMAATFLGFVLQVHAQERTAPDVNEGVKFEDTEVLVPAALVSIWRAYSHSSSH